MTEVVCVQVHCRTVTWVVNVDALSALSASEGQSGRLFTRIDQGSGQPGVDACAAASVTIRFSCHDGIQGDSIVEQDNSDGLLTGTCSGVVLCPEVLFCGKRVGRVAGLCLFGG